MRQKGSPVSRLQPQGNGGNWPCPVSRVVGSRDGRPPPPTLTSRTESFGGTFTLSCLTPFFSGPATLTFHWNNGNTSTVSGNFVARSSGSDLLSTFTGTAIAGEFQGDAVETVLDVAQLDLTQCAKPGGLNHESGVYTATFRKP
ncbi:hypothetical protein ACIHFE_33120 [Streptomyces sp. NPDC052396]|uniref:hypothetical protein n=1 Tax=Streptomyces sp. NPDC052396 TaxID=3365689 RepID=UPI0037CE2CA0